MKTHSPIQGEQQ